MSSWTRIWSDFMVYSRGYLRNRAGLFFGLIFPVILILIFGAIFSGTTGKVAVYVQNEDADGIVSTQLLSGMNSSGTVSIRMVPTGVNLTSYLKNHSVSDGILIPANFSRAYASETHVSLIIYGDPTSSSSTIVLGTVDGVVNYLNLKLFNGTSVIGLERTTVNTQQTKYIDFLIPGLIGFAILVNPMFSLVNISSEYKKEKLFKQLSLTPLTKMEWLIAKIMWYITLSATSFVLMVAVGLFAFGAHITLTVWIIPFLVLGPLLFASLGMLVGTVTKEPETAGVVGNIVTFPMMFLSGTFFPISVMPMYLQGIAHVLPLFYVIEGLNNIMVYDNVSRAVFDLVVTAVIAGVIFVAAVRLFKWRED